MSTAWPTTSAPSRPPRSSGSEAAGAGAAAPACTNCGGALGGRYCGACGQRDLPLNPSSRVLVGELWDTFGSIDGKLVRTLHLLLTRPGALTAEWLNGRRAPYISPLKLYLTVSAVYFAFALTTFRPEEHQLRQTSEEQRLTAKFVAGAERTASTHSRPVAVLARGSARFMGDPVDGVRTSLPNMPRVMFMLVPLFAVLVQAAFRRRGWRYPAHLYFALHVFAFYFSGSLALRALAVYGPRSLYPVGAWALGLGTLAYLGAAMRRVYGGRWRATAARVAFVIGPFYTAFVVTMIVQTVVLLGLR